MNSEKERRFAAIVAGVSSGGVEALKIVLGGLPADFPLPLLVVAHISAEADNGLALLLDDICMIKVKEADEQEEIKPGTVYIAAPNYHLQVERDHTLSFSVDAPVKFARPSVDVLFDAAATVFGSALIGVVMTGAGSDGSNGLKKIKELGGVTVVQDPAGAEADQMPINAIALASPDHVLPLEEISALLMKLARS